MLGAQMDKKGMKRLKITIVTNNEINRSIEELLYKNIAEMIFNSPEFKDKLISRQYGN